jgi:osmotically-inducible protein OsmY
MANNNDWNRNRMGSGQDWDSDDYRNEQGSRQRYGSGYGSGDYRGSGYESDRFRSESDRYREDYNRDSSNSGSDWNRGGNYGSEYNRNRESDYDRAYGRSGDYNRSSDYQRGSWGSNYDRGRNENRNRDRDWWDRTKDEVSSWFGDEDARNRRRMDEKEGPYRGKGPKGYTRSDERIKEDVNDRLNDDSRVDASDIEVSVTGCEVTLTGTVHSREEKRREEDLAEAVSGVNNVENRLRVNQESSWGTQGTGTGSTYRGNTGETAYTGTAASAGSMSGSNSGNSNSGTNRNR